MQKIFSVAIDGPAGAGKSTVAKAVAKALNAAYLDTGAMYRTMGLYMAEHGHRRPEAIAEAARTPEAAATASKVSAVGAVRERLVDLQREIARGQSVVMDGRDIGTVVLPDATVKIYLTASCEVRAKRRFDELTQAGKEIAYEQVLDDIVQRDYNDAHRAVSPMRQADDAVRVDTSEMTRDEVVADIVRRIRTAIEA